MSIVTTDPSGGWTSTAPLRYTSNPWALFIHDMFLFLRHSWSLPFIVWPFWPCHSGELAELYPSAKNLRDIAIHLVLSVAQLLFLFSLVACLVFSVPCGLVLVYVLVFWRTNSFLCTLLLNGYQDRVESDVDLSRFPGKHADEKWIFLNGVGAGHHWLKNNLNRIALTFGRPVLGIHNPTAGIVFDILQCLVQRDFAYVTNDIRNCYKAVKEAITDPQYKKVVFILHSQGGIEGGLILDWLFGDVPLEYTSKLEVYTFGNAANHFNNPMTREAEKMNDSKSSSPVFKRPIRHIEHYANTYDFVSRWGILHFASSRTSGGVHNRFRGRVFEKTGAQGHQFNQHYLDNIFPLDKERGFGASERNPFMDSVVQIAEDPSTSTQNADSEAGDSTQIVIVRNLTFPRGRAQSLLSASTRSSTKKVSELSRLWAYRNGKSPGD